MQTKFGRACGSGECGLRKCVFVKTNTPDKGGRKRTEGSLEPRISSPREVGESREMSQDTGKRMSQEEDGRGGLEKPPAEPREVGASRSRHLLTQWSTRMARRGDRNGRLGNLDDGSKKLGPKLHAEVVPKSPRRRNLKDLQQAGGAQILPRPAGINAIDKHPGPTNSFPRQKLGFLLTGPVPDRASPQNCPRHWRRPELSPPCNLGLVTGFFQLQTRNSSFASKAATSVKPRATRTELHDANQRRWLRAWFICA